MDKILKIMPQLSKRFASDRDQIVEILQKMQKGTRILQSLCLHCKSTKDPTLINAIPSLKKNLERVIFNVKSILEAHGCLKAFWVGNLKTKNLRGEEISSQVNNPRCNVILPTFHNTVYPSVRGANCQRRQRRCFWSR
jgi:Fanconi anemia group D2 protein